ncbi:MAG: hypothetical protein WD490_04035 [Opitutales bacterium]
MKVSTSHLLPLFRLVIVWLAVLAAGLLFLPDRLDRVRYDQDIGHADGVAYAWQARALIRGDGLSVPYISNFFHPYPTDFSRHDDHWAPLLSFVLAPVFHFFGPEAHVARMTTVVISTLFLPLCFCIMVQALTGRAWTGFPAALPLFSSTHLMQEGMRILNDQLVTSVLCLFLAALVASKRRPALILLCGPLIALAWYGKGSQILLFPFAAAAAALLHGPRFLIRKEFLGMLLLTLCLMFPRLQANARLFSRPLHSTQSYVSSYFGLSRHSGAGWDAGFYSIHWNRHPPTLRNRFDHPFLHQRSIRENSEAFLRWHLLGLDAQAKDGKHLGPGASSLLSALRNQKSIRPLNELWKDTTKEWNLSEDHPRPWFTRIQIVSLLWGALAVLISVEVWCVRRFRKDAPTGGGWTDPASVLLMFCLTQAVFMIVCWQAMERLSFPSLIPALALPWTLLAVSLDTAKALRRRFIRIPTPAWAGTVLTLLFSLAVFSQFHAPAAEIARQQRESFKHPPPEEPRYPGEKRLGDHMAETLPPDSILMCRNPWQTLWYAPETFRAIGLPYARTPELLAVARHYGVTHFVNDRDRQGLRRFIRKHPDAFECVIHKPIEVYRIHYDHLPDDFLTPLRDIKPMWDAREDLREQETKLREASQGFQKSEEERSEVGN